jgi:hypothetical protein
VPNLHLGGRWASARAGGVGDIVNPYDQSVVAGCCPRLEFDGTAEGDGRKAGEVRLREAWWRPLMEVVS